MFRCLTLVLLVLLSTGIHAKDWYTVEVLIFARSNPDSAEIWDMDKQPSYASEAFSLSDPAATGADPGALANGAWQPLPRDQKILRYMMERMAGTGQYQSLFHEAWRQPVSSDGQSKPIYIQGGRAIPTEDGTVPEVEGTLRFSQSRYLHLKPQIWFNARHNGQRFYVDLHRKQRLKGKDVYYFDHPLFGMLVRVTK